MADDKPNLPDSTSEPSGDAAPVQGETKKVDTEAQEDAAKDREESRGYQ